MVITYSLENLHFSSLFFDLSIEVQFLLVFFVALDVFTHYECIQHNHESIDPPISRFGGSKPPTMMIKRDKICLNTMVLFVFYLNAFRLCANSLGTPRDGG